MRIINILKGLLVGVGLIVPGLSGSVLAIILGLYKNILIAVTEMRTNFKKSMGFLLPIGLGIVLGILISAPFVNVVIIRFPVFSYAFFIGLMLGASPLIIRKIRPTEKKFNPLHLIWTVLAFVFIIILSSGNTSDEHIAIHYLSSARDFLDLFLAGLITLSLMAVPGISGSMIIMVLGQFGTVYNAVATLPTFLLSLVGIGEATGSGSTVALLIPFALGAIVGIISIAKIMVWLLNKYETAVYFAVLGAVLGTITALAQIGISGVTVHGNIFLYIAISLLWLVLGFLVTLYLDSKGNREDE
ncbi:MAG: DUF368 domain-containing protein [Defluviitaleaceae bacterium]|nr:DUF368 domain-containing protein [Defluviitaleaceae bacterium]